MLPTLLALATLSSHAGQQQDQALPAGVDTRTGYRMSRYRGPTPAVLPGGTAVSDSWVREPRNRTDLVLIDVYPPKGLGPDPLDGSWRTSEKRLSIPGSTWLPEVGRGHLEPDAKAYFERQLERLTNGNREHAILFFCTADCWQGWNAARRAVRLGYQQVFWYANGTDGWAEHGGELQRVEPVNFLR